MSLFTTFTDHFESGARKFLPYSLIVLLLLLNCMSVPFVMGGGIKAPLFLMGLYYWSIYRPTLIPPWMAFAAGMVADLLGGLPVGLSAAIFVLVQWSISDQRRFLMGQSFVMIWFGFFLLSTFTGLLQWLVFGLINLHWPSIKPLFFSILLGQALFPLVNILLHWTHKFLPSGGGSLDRTR